MYLQVINFFIRNDAIADLPYGAHFSLIQVSMMETLSQHNSPYAY